MKKSLPIILIVVLVAGGAWYMFSTSNSEHGDSLQASQASDVTQASAAPSGESQPYQEYDEELDIRPAIEVYPNSDDAFAALKKGAVSYDDIVLEQFVELGDCAWCPDLYRRLQQEMLNPESSDDEKAYFAEVLAISGKVENVQTIVEAIESAKNEDDADVYAEGLELTVGNDAVVSYLKGKLDSDNELLKESVVAAITNQGSLLAAETLYQHTVETGDPDGYYSIGIGLAEFVPEPESMPYLQELMLKRDPYSHLAVKALLNEGTQGLSMVFDALEGSQNEEFDRQMLKDALDHVAYEEEIEGLLRAKAEGARTAVAREFAAEVLEDFELEAEDDYDYDYDEPEAESEGAGSQ